MTLKEFITKYNAKHWDFDNKPPFNQCMDIYRQYVKEVWQQPQTPTVVGAKDVFATINPAHYDKFTSGQLLPGDVVVWNEQFASPNGHIAIVENPSDPKSLVVFGQNDPLGSVCKLSRHSYANIIGWFRPKAVLQKTFMGVTAVGNKIAWDYKAQLPIVSQWFKQYSGDKFEPVFDAVDTHFDSIPLMPFDGTQSVDVAWYRQNVTPLTKGQGTVLILNPDQYQIPNIWGWMTYGDTGKPVRMEVACDDEPNFPEAHLVVHRIFHELCHALYFLSDVPDIGHQNPAIPRVHELLFVPENQLPAARTTLLNEINYKRLQEKLVAIK